MSLTLRFFMSYLSQFLGALTQPVFFKKIIIFNSMFWAKLELRGLNPRGK